LSTLFAILEQFALMQWKRTTLVAVSFGVLVWLAIGVLETIGDQGLAGPVVGNNLETGTDATGLFYTELDRSIFRQIERPEQRSD